MSRYNDMARGVTDAVERTRAAAPVSAHEPDRLRCSAAGCPLAGAIGRGRQATCREHYGKPQWQWREITARVVGQQGMFDRPQSAGPSPAVLAMRAKVKRPPDRVPGEDDA